MNDPNGTGPTRQEGVRPNRPLLARTVDNCGADCDIVFNLGAKADDGIHLRRGATCNWLLP